MRIVVYICLVLVGPYAMGQSPLFQSVESELSGVLFSNDITEDDKTNIMQYDYLYNGAGVGIGDFNKDGLPDIFLAGNMVDDRLYFNKGKLQFDDVSKESGISLNGWSSGVCVFDVNGDGWDDIYVLRSGPAAYDDRLENVLYVNQQDGSFKNEASNYGLNLKGHHIQAAPLDIDLDGDLDLYIMGHPGKFKHKVDFQTMLKEIQEGKVESDLLLENVNGQYVDITEEAGIEEYGYGLGLAITDINRDNYPDIIVCNDFDEPDHLFINQQNNTFKDENLTYFKHTSNYSMGNDVGDINNDGLMDYISVDMAFEQHERSKTNMASMNPEKFYARVKLGWGYQYMHNMLHVNTGMGSFQEIAQFAGVAKTDWSWAPLFFDMDMDGKKDLFITNGYKRDTKNNDIGYLLKQAQERKGELTIKEFLELIPSVRIENFFFKNTNGLKFEDKRGDWGVDEKLNSNGAAYADLDGDGDLDLVLNNVDTLASIYENKGTHENRLVVDFSQLKDQAYLGARVVASDGVVHFYQEAYFVRGYCSTVEKKLYFYSNKPLASLMFYLPDGTVYIDKNVKEKNNYIVPEGFEGLDKFVNTPSNPDRIGGNRFKDVTTQFKLDAVYLDNKFNDFEKEGLLPHMMTTAGPIIEVADLDKNGLDDFVVSNSVGKIPTVFLQNPNGTFKKKNSSAFYNHQSSETTGIHAFHVNNDGNLDLFMTSGGYQWAEGDTAYENRLYIGNGLGMFGLVENAILSKDLSNSGKVIGEDIDGDGDTDMLICGKGYPGKYPYSGRTKIYMNEKGYFVDRTKEVAPQIEHLGIVNDACFSDLDYDGDKDILLVGEWMEIEWMENKGGGFIHHKNNIGWPGWWNCILAYDIDNDGDDDYILGNEGMNNKFKASKENPLEIYANDFDNSGSLDIVLAHSKDDYKLPVRGRECSSTQMPFIQDKFPTFLEFATSDLESIYGKEKLDQALHYQVTEFRNGIMYNNGDKGLSFVPFQDEAQFSSINAYQVVDVNGDDLPDIIGVGNRYNTEVETTRSDAGCGIVMLQMPDGTFSYLAPRYSGFYAPHNAKSLEIIKLGKENEIGLLVGNNNHKLQLFKFIPQK